MTVAALKRSTLYAIVPWGLQRRQSRERRGRSAVPGMGSFSSAEDARFFWAPRHSRAASLNLPSCFYQSWYFFLLFFFFYFSLPALNFTQLPALGCRAAAQRVWVPSTQAPSPGCRHTLNPPQPSPRGTPQSHGNGEGRALRGNVSFSPSHLAPSHPSPIHPPAARGPFSSAGDRHQEMRSQRRLCA